jgi:hypothetical protein
MKELLSMQRHRGLLLGSAMAALLGFMGSQAQAATVTISVDLGGTVIYSTSGAVNITALNTDLKNAGSAYQFATNGLTASSQLQSDGEVALTTTGSIIILATGSTTPTLSIDVVATGILAPVGSGGTLASSASGTYSGVSSGTTTFTGDYQGTTLTPAIVGTASGGTTSYGSTNAVQSIGTVPSGYSLSNHFVIGLSQNVGGTEGLSGSVIVSTVVPEPSSVVMLLTGMPLPLAMVFGLIRRRRAMA